MFILLWSPVIHRIWQYSLARVDPMESFCTSLQALGEMIYPHEEQLTVMRNETEWKAQ